MRFVSVRGLIYLTIFIIFVFSIEAKKAEVSRLRSKDVTSILSLMIEGGAPVTAYKVDYKNLVISDKVTIKKCNNDFCFYTSRDGRSKLKVGAKVFELSTDNSIGSIKSIGLKADYRNGLYKVIVNLDKPIKYFMVSEVEIKTFNDVITIPIQALEDQKYVWLIKDNETAERIALKLGQRNSRYVQVIDGLKSNQSIILDGANQIPIYKKIKIINSVEKENSTAQPNKSEAQS